MNDLPENMEKRLQRLEREIQRIQQLYDRTLSYEEEDPETALMHARKAAEAICRHLFIREISPNPGNLMLDDLIKKLVAKGKLPKSIAVPLRTIQSYGNFGAHEHGEDLADSITAEYIRPCLGALAVVVNWYVTQVGGHDSQTPRPPASPPRGEAPAPAGVVSAPEAPPPADPTPEAEAPPEEPAPPPEPAVPEPEPEFTPFAWRHVHPRYRAFIRSVAAEGALVVADPATGDWVLPAPEASLSGEDATDLPPPEGLRLVDGKLLPVVTYPGLLAARARPLLQALAEKMREKGNREKAYLLAWAEGDTDAFEYELLKARHRLPPAESILAYLALAGNFAKARECFAEALKETDPKTPAADLALLARQGLQDPALGDDPACQIPPGGEWIAALARAEAALMVENDTEAAFRILKTLTRSAPPDTLAAATALSRTWFRLLGDREEAKAVFMAYGKGTQEDLPALVRAAAELFGPGAEGEEIVHTWLAAGSRDLAQFLAAARLLAGIGTRPALLTTLLEKAETSAESPEDWQALGEAWETCLPASPHAARCRQQAGIVSRELEAKRFEKHEEAIREEIAGIGPPGGSRIETPINRLFEIQALPIDRRIEFLFSVPRDDREKLLRKYVEKAEDGRDKVEHLSLSNVFDPKSLNRAQWIKMLGFLCSCDISCREDWLDWAHTLCTDDEEKTVHEFLECIADLDAFMAFWSSLPDRKEDCYIRGAVLDSMIRLCAAGDNVRKRMTLNAITANIAAQRRDPGQFDKVFFFRAHPDRLFDEFQKKLEDETNSFLNNEEQAALFGFLLPLMVDSRDTHTFTHFHYTRLLSSFKETIRILDEICEIHSRIKKSSEDADHRRWVEEHIEELEKLLGIRFKKDFLRRRRKGFLAWWESEGKRKYRDDLLRNYPPPTLPIIKNVHR